MAHNIRFPQMWDIITKHVDFKGKTLLDIGFGYGDLLKAAHSAGAKVYGIDQAAELVSNLRVYNSTTFNVRRANIEEIFYSKETLPKVDILTCFSVLPYLSDPDKMLNYFSGLSPQVLIECQYAGDGPGLDWLKGDADMQIWLDTIWYDVEKIGETKVEGRGYRSIWLCQ